MRVASIHPTPQADQNDHYALAEQRFLTVLRDPRNLSRTLAELLPVALISASTWEIIVRRPAFRDAVATAGYKLQKLKRHTTSEAQQRLLAVLQDPANRNKSVQEICELAGYKGAGPWRSAMGDPEFVAEVERLGVTVRRQAVKSAERARRVQDRAMVRLRRVEETPVVSVCATTDDESLLTYKERQILEVLRNPDNKGKKLPEILHLAGVSRGTWDRAVMSESFHAKAVATGFQIRLRNRSDYFAPAQRAFLRVLEDPENRSKTVLEVCNLAGYEHTRAWHVAINSERFVAELQRLGVPVKRRSTYEPHVEVAADPETELAKDVWDLRRIRNDYPKHRSVGDLIVDFRVIANPTLRQQVKQYFRNRLPKWKPRTFKGTLDRLRLFLDLLPPDVHVGTLSRAHIEAILPHLFDETSDTTRRALQTMRQMLHHMATSKLWTGTRPPRGLIWDDDFPAATQQLPRPIPPEVLDQLDPLLEKSIRAVAVGQAPPIMDGTFWDAVLILRRTGIRYEDLAHLKAPGGMNGCLDQDAEGYYWLRIDHDMTKMARDHRVPVAGSDGTVEAIRRQAQRVVTIPDLYGQNYLFRTKDGVMSYGAFNAKFHTVARHLTYEGRPYKISPHQFRHTIATDMVEKGIDMYTIKEFLGHRSLAMTERYVKLYLKSLKARYDEYRLKHSNTHSTVLPDDLEVTESATSADSDGGWAEGKVGKLYRSPLPDGIGFCEHLPMHDPCPTAPHCPTCPKLKAGPQHIKIWENKIEALRYTVEALRSNSAFARARQKHEAELHHAEVVARTIKEVGFWDGRIHNE